MKAINVKVQGDKYQAVIDGVEVRGITEESRFWPSVQEWLTVNTPEPEFTDIELAEIAYQEALTNLKAVRDTALSALTHQFADGSVVQVRPKDMPNFQIAISFGQSEEWVMADDNVRLLTVAEMQEAMNSGIAQGKVIWNNYTAELKLL